MDTRRRTHANSCLPPCHPHTAQMRTGNRPEHIRTRQPLNRQLTRASFRATFTPAPAPRQTRRHASQMHPARPATRPQLHAGISASEKSPTQAAVPHRSPLSGAQFSAKRIGAPPRSLPPVDSGNGLRVLTLSFLTRFPAGLPVPTHLSFPSISALWP